MAVVRRVATVRAVMQAGPQHAEPRARVAGVLAAAPLPVDVDLVLQRVDADGALELVTRRLFAAGTRAMDGARERVVVHGSPVGNPAAAIPVVARTGPDPASWRVLGMGRTDLPPRSSAQVEFTLTGAGGVALTRTDGVRVRDAAETPLGSLVAGIPGRVPLAPPLDLVCAVELCGTPEDVGARLQFARRLVELVAARHLRPEAVRFGVVGYGDHWDRPTAAYPLNEVVEGGDALTSAGDALAALGRLHRRPPLRDAATALEDALHCLARLRWERAERVLVVVGHRPAGYAGGSGPVPTCPVELHWGTAAERLRAAHVRIIGVRDPRPVTRLGGHDGDAIRAYADQFWHGLAGAHLVPFGPDAVEPVVASVIRDTSLPAEAFPLALAAPVGTGAPIRPSTTARSAERTSR